MPHSVRGIVLKIAATISFSLMYALIKLAGAVPVGEVVFFRAFFALAPLFALSFYTVGPANVARTARSGWHILRSAAGVTGMFMNFAALKLLPLADVTAFSFVAPIFAVVLAATMLRERVGPYRGFAVAAGFVVVFIRQMSTTERSETIVFYFMTVCSLAGLATMLWSRVALSANQAMLLMLCGVLGGIGQICMTFSYRYAEPSLLAPFDYIAMVWAVALGYFVFAEVPEQMVMIGACAVVAAGLFIAWRERNIHLAPIPPSQPL